MHRNVTIRPRRVVTPATYPSVLKTSGQNIVDANGYVLGGPGVKPMRGFDIQISFLQSAAAYNTMASKGCSLNRLVVDWDLLQPTAPSGPTDYSTISASNVTTLDTNISRMVAAGMYGIIDFYYGPGGVHKPSWVTDSSVASLITSGQSAVQYLANRYGNPSSPQYTPAIIGFNVNEPTPDDLTLAGYITTMEGQFRTLVGWFRTYAPNWIWFMSYAFALGSPLPNLTSAGHTSDQTFNAADPHAFDSVGGNWAVDLHDEIKRTASTTTNYDGRDAHGSSSVWSPFGGTQCQTGTGFRIKVGDGTSGTCANGAYDLAPYPPTYGAVTSRTICQSQMSAYVYPYKLFCGPANANVPLIAGETMAWTSRDTTGATNYVDDKWAVHLDAGVAGECQWDYGTNQTSDIWAADPGIGQTNADTDGWLVSTNYWLGL